MKQYERLTETQAMSFLPLLARIDGRAFHTFTAGLERPFDARFSKLMIDTTAYLVKSVAAQIGYVQSDEISLLWMQQTHESQLPFGGRVLKLTSVLASLAGAFFNKHLADFLPEKADQVPVFDCRVWSVPSRAEAVNYFIWRERDATKNSIQMAAQRHFSHKELRGKNGSDQQEMLFQKGINWNDYPAFFKRGTFVKRRPYTLGATRLEAGAPIVEVVRHEVVPVPCDPFVSMSDKLGFLFNTDD